MPPNQGYVLWEVEKDTTIQDKQVRKIVKTRFYSNGIDTAKLENVFTYKENDTVYVWHNGSFRFLYDLNANAGDWHRSHNSLIFNML
ncbi:MAG: hypothetical protein ACK5HT_14235 [Draconibacterium sp.]